MIGAKMQLNNYNKNKISLDELQALYGIKDYTNLVNLVNTLTEEGHLSPIKSSKSNGKKPPLFNRYHIIKKQEDVSKLTEELLYQLNPMLKNDYYLKNIEVYKSDRPYVRLLNDFFQNHKESLQNAVSYNERSFEIWGREKFLLREGGIRILKNVGLSEDDLNVYPTTEPLAYYSKYKTTPQKILILENKDTFYSMRKHLLDGNTTILGVDFGTLIYGSGKSIYKSFSDFTFCVEPYLSDETNEILYFGDLDYEGIIIYETLQECFQEKIIVKPFCLAYEVMLIKAKAYELPFMKEGQNRNIGSSFFAYFNKEIQEQMKLILKENRYIPQEILQIVDL